MGLEKLFKNLRVISASTTLAAGLLATIVLTGTFINEAQAQDKIPATKPNVAFTLRIGSGFDRLEAVGIADDLRAEGCSAVITNEQSILGFLTVENVDNAYDFYKDEAGDANYTAVKWCKEARVLTSTKSR